MRRPGSSRLTRTEVSWIDWIKPLSWGWSRWLPALFSVICGQKAAVHFSRGECDEVGKGNLWSVSAWEPRGEGNKDKTVSSFQPPRNFFLKDVCCNLLWWCVKPCAVKKQSCVHGQNSLTGMELALPLAVEAPSGTDIDACNQLETSWDLNSYWVNICDTDTAPENTLQRRKWARSILLVQKYSLAVLLLFGNSFPWD